MASESKIRVMIADDHDMLRSGLKVFLKSYNDIELVAEASDGEQTIWYCQQYNPEVVLIDLKMPRIDGVTAIRKVKEQQPHIQFIVLTTFIDEDTVQSALEAGAIGYLLKDAGAQELYTAIIRAKGGKSFLTPEATQVLVEAVTRPPEVGHDLTEREVEILTLLVTGMSNSEIGDKLYISRSTVKNHVSNIFAKLGVDSRTEAAALAVQYGIVKMQEDDEV